MNPRARIGILALTLSAAGFVGILKREDYREQAYPDPTYGWKVPTAGFGTTEGVKQGDSLKVVPAIERALQDAGKYESAIKRCVTAPLHQAEYDIYVNLSYNIGSAGFCNSQIVEHLNQFDYKGACDAILLWKKSNGQDCSAPGNRTCSGMWKDRLKVHAACMAAQTPISMSAPVLPAATPPPTTALPAAVLSPVVVAPPPAAVPPKRWWQWK